MNRISSVLVWVLLAAVIGLSVQVYRLSVKLDRAEFKQIRVRSLDLVNDDGSVGGKFRGGSSGPGADGPSIRLEKKNPTYGMMRIEMTLYGPRIQMMNNWKIGEHSEAVIDLGCDSISNGLTIKGPSSSVTELSLQCNNIGKDIIPYTVLFPVQPKIWAHTPVSPDPAPAEANK